jgi:putative transposase
MSQPSVTYKRHRFPPQIIAHAVWLYYRFPLSLRLVEEMLLERGVTVSYETIRRWGSSSDRIMPGAFVARMPDVEHRSHKGLNNRAENSHLPLRKRERMMQGFPSPGSLQRFVAIFSALRNLLVPPRSDRSAHAIRHHRLDAMAQWNTATIAAA